MMRRRYRKRSLPESEGNQYVPETPLSRNLDENLKQLQEIYKNCSDCVFHHFHIFGKIRAVLIYIEGLSNLEEMDDNVLGPLMAQAHPSMEPFGDGRHLPGTEPEPQTISKENARMETRRNKEKGTPAHTDSGQTDSRPGGFPHFSHWIKVAGKKEVKTISECIESISTGCPVLLADGFETGTSLSLQKWEKRGMEEPIAESVIRGPREGFVETLRSNTALLRRKIRSPHLKMETMEIGRYTRTKVVIAYIDSLTDKTLVDEVKNRLKRIDIDGVLDSGYIEEMIEDNPYSPFPQALNTERPDVAISGLLEGRVAILVDGSPVALIVPITFFSLLQASEDYYNRFLIATAIRWLRFIFLFISLFLPSLYVAVITFHQEMVPTTLLLSMARSREQIPFPALVEALIMEITFEILREAGIRLPKQVGAAVSIVGALVIGQAAVSAGIVSTPMVIVVAVTGIASFATPRFNAAIAFRLLRFPIILLGGSLGMAGIVAGVIAVVLHLCSLRSFGIPYLAPIAPIQPGELKDVLIRVPLWNRKTRPHLTGTYDRYRTADDLKPGPAKEAEGQARDP